MRTDELIKFIKARHGIYQRRELGNPKPWTTDPILQRYRFCNVYRELDTVTQWIASNWRNPHKDDPNLFFAMAVARLVNWPISLAEIGYPVPWRQTEFWRILDARKREKQKVFTGAYMVRADAYSNSSKARYLAERVLTPMWTDREEIYKVIKRRNLQSVHEKLTTYRDMGSFMAAQVIADLKYAPPLDKANDWWDWAASGPGSMRGLNRVWGRDLKGSWVGNDWLSALRVLQEDLNPLIKKAGMERLHAQDLQNCLCEFDKYERVRLGEGKPRSLYPGLPV